MCLAKCSKNGSYIFIDIIAEIMYCCPCSGVVFKGTTIGMAPLEGMCSHENSGGINVVRKRACLHLEQAVNSVCIDCFFVYGSCGDLIK